MITLSLGVRDIPYTNGKTTTGDVAEILEAKYHIFEHFWQLHQGEIISELTEAITGAFESSMMGAPPPNDPHAAATNEIEKLFNTFLDSRELDTLGIPGIPTAASLGGKSSRFKQKQKKGRRSRPSFIDTGLLEASMTAWVSSE